MGEIGKYLYGIIVSSNKQELSALEQTHGPLPPYPLPSPTLLAPRCENGLAQGGGVLARERVYIIPYNDVSALISDSEMVDYTHMHKDALARLLVRHQQVIEEVMAEEHEVIPMRLGTFAQDEAEVRDILKKGYSLIKEVGEKIAHNIETDVVVSWSNVLSVIKEIGEEREIKEFKERLMADPKGIKPEDQMKVGLMVKKALDARREQQAEEIQEALKTACQALKVHDLMDDSMVANMALFLDKSQQGDFDRKVEELNARYAERLHFRCVGPLPPYSFYTLEVKKMHLEEVDWARKKLGLGELTGRKEVEKAYRRAAFSCHPDRNPYTPGGEKEFDDTARAYQILLDYCQAFEQAHPGEGYSFHEREFRDNGLFVKVRG